MGKESRLRRPSFLIVFGEADPPALSDFQGFTKDVIGRPHAAAWDCWFGMTLRFAIPEG